ncbi:type IV-A pilus assembly ATPase PilB [Acinetobacter baumannii]|uniref:type IV-A pilus assembly ATPase PilB n=1 Tax=Acinetobacter baumannii TaxID=470 RepID=UPI0008DE5FB6|nr:type IV-A pilus assembly ATPase PilB [Acinetobacter baumannii]OIH12060.1 type IV-A pilus assembly ATPase PilB [Acinetobacter baumannii]
MSKIKLTDLERQLISKNILTSEQLQKISEDAENNGRDILTEIVSSRLVNEKVLAKEIAEHFHMPFFDWAEFDIVASNQNFPIDENVIINLRILPIEYDDRADMPNMTVLIGYPDRDTIEAIDKIKSLKSIGIEIKISEISMIADYIDTRYGSQSEKTVTKEELLSFIINNDNTVVVERLVDNSENKPVENYVIQKLKDAIFQKASDIHFEPYEDSYRIRYRTDGVLELKETLPSNAKDRLTGVLKVMSKMDISEKRNPQDGRIDVMVGKKKIDFRVNSMPTVFGEKIVCRLLDPTSTQMGIEALGFNPQQMELYKEALEKPQGMILVTGPTGSGKTISMYSGLHSLNTIDKNISTAEEPVEMNIKGINQVQVNPRAGLTFASILRAVLRQDPDVIMVGEIRDLETAEIAIKAAQTGHLVLSTLHTNSAAETLTRLQNIGIPTYNIATTVSLVIAQRLARVLCRKCKVPVELPRKTLLNIGFDESEIDDPNFRIYDPVGCASCNKGYKGRTGVYEVVKVNKEIAAIIMNDGNAIEIDEAAKASGYQSLRRSALDKVKSGHTSLQEVMRITVD